MTGTVLLTPCEIGDTVYCVGQCTEKEAPFIESYTVSAVMWDGKKWYVTDDFSTFNEIGTEEAILDAAKAIEIFKAKRDEYIKNGGKI